MKIVILDAYTTNPGDLSWEPLCRFGDLTVYDRTAPEDVLSRIGDAEIVYTNKTVLPQDLFERCPSIRFMGLLSTGYNVVDLDAATRADVTVCNIPAYSTDSVAQLTIALLLELCFRVGEHSRAVHEGAWTNAKDFCFWNYPLTELAGKTIGIVGFGAIGRSVADIAAALKMRVVYTNSSGRRADKYTYLPLDEVFAVSDVLSFHCPLTPATTGLVCKDTIQKMKDGCFIINTSRGPVVCEQDLYDALVSGKVAGAAMDVLSTEPPKADNPLLSAENCIITPHIAWATPEARARLVEIAVRNLECFTAGKPINKVN